MGAGLGVGVVGEESTVGNSCAHAVNPRVTAAIQVAFDKYDLCRKTKTSPTDKNLLSVPYLCPILQEY